MEDLVLAEAGAPLLGHKRGGCDELEELCPSCHAIGSLCHSRMAQTNGGSNKANELSLCQRNACRENAMLQVLEFDEDVQRARGSEMIPDATSVVKKRSRRRITHNSDMIDETSGSQSQFRRQPSLSMRDAILTSLLISNIKGLSQLLAHHAQLGKGIHKHSPDERAHTHPHRHLDRSHGRTSELRVG